LRPLAEGSRTSEASAPLTLAPTHGFSVQWVAQGWPEDIERGIESFRRFQGERRVQHVVVDATGLNRPWPPDADVITIDPALGWAAARNAALLRSAGAIVILVDGSVEATGDVFGLLEEALTNATIGVCGPFGIVSDDLREFHESEGPDVDAIEGYLMAFRRELAERGMRFDEKYRFYRTADIELSFQVKAMGLRAEVTPIPVRRHEHRMWATTPEDERQKLSKRNFYRFLDKWRTRTDLLVSSSRCD
jgi:cysteinyl-tRNA synthetase